MRVLIIGGGVVGASIAYRLASRGVEVTVVERGEVACAASGKSGGFLALDWCDGTPLQQLARRSFALHAELPAALGDDWGYRRLETFGGSVGLSDTSGDRRLRWTSAALHVSGRLGTAETTAQVHPLAFTRAMMRAAERHGAKVFHGQATGLVERTGRVVGVVADGGTLEADAVVIAMGPWSTLATEWLPLPPVYGLKGHSVVFQTGDDIPPEALFLEVEEASGAVLTPEVFPRSDGTTYVCAISSERPLPANPREVQPDPGAIDRLIDLCGSISPALKPSRVVSTQACFRPVTRDGLPMIGPVPGVAGVTIATGHGVWGILNAPATAEAMAELILDGTTRSVDLRPLDPGRLRSARQVPIRRSQPPASAAT